MVVFFAFASENLIESSQDSGTPHLISNLTYLLDNAQHSIPCTAEQILWGVPTLSQGNLIIILINWRLVVSLLHCVQHLYMVSYRFQKHKSLMEKPCS